MSSLVGDSGVKPVLLLSIALGSLFACSENNEKEYNPFQVTDPDLKIELIAEQPDIMTPIGMAFDDQDALYVLESHTHSPPSDYAGPKFDRIKKGVDEDGDGKPDRWEIYADSIENGINLAIDQEGTVFLAAKKSLLAFRDQDGDGISDGRSTLLKMPLPDYVYDHAGLLGVALGPDDWVYVSRGNLGSKAWKIAGSDGSTIDGYGDGGVVMRCKKDGAQLEYLASGFWNPFDIKFTQDGRLMLTDNDPDSRGPNRLIELVPGGDYGFKSLYGGNGLHPYVAWNGELPGTLPFAAALGEAPCALLDAGYANFGEDYTGSILVNVWEENNIVQIPLHPQGSTVAGQAKVLVQGDSSFHPVALATNSRGDLYITDWVVREYPNHGQGKIWRLSGGNDNSENTREESQPKINRFAKTNQSIEELIEILRSGDDFQRAIARRTLTDPRYQEELLELIDGEDAVLQLQAVLTLQKAKFSLDKTQLEKLLMDPNEDIRKMALIYIGTMMRTDLNDGLQKALAANKIGVPLFDTYLATIQHLQPAFIENYTSRSGISADKIEPKLPEAYIATLINHTAIPEATRAIALPYLEEPQQERSLLLNLLQQSSNDDFSVGLLNALRFSVDEEVAQAMAGIALDQEATPALRAQAVMLLTYQQADYCTEIKNLLTEDEVLLRQSAIKYLCRCSTDLQTKEEVSAWVANAGESLQATWNKCIGQAENQPVTQEEWTAAVDEHGNAVLGKLVFESVQAQCQTCHQVGGWGGTYGPNLSNIGSSKSKTQLANAILEPSLEIAPEWQGWFVVDQEGNRHQGRQIDVNSNFTELLNQEGAFDRYEHPKAFGVLNQSLMPTGLQNTMTAEEFNHLIAYLASLK
ncbi:MAG: c-type cytochrome [Cyclobacteriaceae bacterium]